MINHSDMNILKKIHFNYMYLNNPPWDTGITPPELVDFISNTPPGRALDLGCGPGTNAVYMAKKGWEVSGVDFVGRAIRTARKKAKHEGVFIDFRLDDVTRLKGISGPFDLILDIGCFHNLSDTDKNIYIRNVDRLLALQGTYLIYTFIKSNPSQKNGITDQDFNAFGKFLNLASRQDGTERGIRPSTWLRFVR